MIITSGYVTIPSYISADALYLQNHVIIELGFGSVGLPDEAMMVERSKELMGRWK